MCLKTYLKFVVLSAVIWIVNIITSIKAHDDRGVFGPFASMLKMHIAILCLGFASTLGLGRYSLYVILVIFYFPFAVIQDKPAAAEGQES